MTTGKRHRAAGGEAMFEVPIDREINQIRMPSFDAVISRLVIHHSPDDLKRKAFAEIFHSLETQRNFTYRRFNPPPIRCMLTLSTWHWTPTG